MLWTGHSISSLSVWIKHGFRTSNCKQFCYKSIAWLKLYTHDHENYLHCSTLQILFLLCSATQLSYTFHVAALLIVSVWAHSMFVRPLVNWKTGCVFVDVENLRVHIRLLSLWATHKGFIWPVQGSVMETCRACNSCCNNCTCMLTPAGAPVRGCIYLAAQHSCISVYLRAFCESQLVWLAEDLKVRNIGLHALTCLGADATPR